jgi:hypothetical protein
VELELQIIGVKLNIEREKRAVAERRLEAIERKRSKPFVVPAVFKAFVEVSRLTNGMSMEKAESQHCVG